MTLPVREISRAALVLAGLCATQAHADSVEDFYRGRSITFDVGAAPGGGYDTTARLVAMHLGSHIPGHPTIVVKNMPGAGSLQLTNFMYNSAPKDGTEIGMPQNGIAFEPMFHMLSKDGANLHFDATKFNWIGNPVVESFVIISWHATPYKTVDDLKNGAMVTGATGVETDNALLPAILSRIIGVKFDMVTGYHGPNDLFIAMERGEIQADGAVGYSGLLATKGDWLRDKKINVLVQFGLKPDARIPDVPMALNLAKTDADRQALALIFSKYQLTRPIFAPPGVPKDRVEALRRAFDAMTEDPAFLADAKRLSTDITRVSGTEVEAVIDKAYQASPAVLERARALMAPLH